MVMSRVLLTGCNLSHSDFERAELSFSDLRKANLASCLFGGADMVGADLSEAVIEKAELGAYLEKSRLVEVVGEGANLECACLFEADLRRSNFRGCMAMHALMRYAVLNEACFDGSWLTGADLSHTISNQASFKEANLNEVRMIDADFTEAVFNKAQMCGSDLRKCKLESAELIECDLRKSDLRFAILYGTDLSNANLKDAILSGARFDRKTLWPKDFDPMRAGTIMDSS